MCCRILAVSLLLFAASGRVTAADLRSPPTDEEIINASNALTPKIKVLTPPLQEPVRDALIELRRDIDWKSKCEFAETVQPCVVDSAVAAMNALPDGKLDKSLVESLDTTLATLLDARTGTKAGQELLASLLLSAIENSSVSTGKSLSDDVKKRLQKAVDDLNSLSSVAAADLLKARLDDLQKRISKLEEPPSAPAGQQETPGPRDQGTAQPEILDDIRKASTLVRAMPSTAPDPKVKAELEKLRKEISPRLCQGADRECLVASVLGAIKALDGDAARSAPTDGQFKALLNTSLTRVLAIIDKSEPSIFAGHVAARIAKIKEAQDNVSLTKSARETLKKVNTRIQTAIGSSSLVAKIYVYGAFFGDVEDIIALVKRTGVAPGGFNRRFCSATRAVRSICHGKAACFELRKDTLALDGIPANVTGQSLCGYDPTPYAEEKTKGLVVYYQCERWPDETWNDLRSSPFHPEDMPYPRLKSADYAAILRSGQIAEIRCSGTPAQADAK